MLPLSLLSQLPPAPKGKKGWPWTEESPAVSPTMPSGKPWPKISIVTPSFNQGQFIEETIRSVLLQNYPNFEYVVIDGGSTDNSVEIIKKYEPWLTYWVSEADSGQSHAINKGFDLCTGDIFNWLCSDDVFLKKTFQNVALLIQLDDPCWVIGSAFIINKNNRIIKKQLAPPTVSLITFLKWSSDFFYQPSTFWNKEIFTKVNKLDEDIHYFMDLDLWYKFFKITPPITEDVFLSFARSHESSKTTGKSQTNFFFNELSLWIIHNILQIDENTTYQEITAGFKSIQRDLSSFKRIKSHFLFRVLFMFWKKYINKDFPTD